MKNPLIFLFLIIFSFANSFGQSKKEQIELLNYRVDSLIQALGTERNSFQTTRASLDQQKAYLEQQIVELTNAITKLKVQGERDDRSIEAYKAALSDALSEKVYLSTVLKQKNDSLQTILMDFEKFNFDGIYTNEAGQNLTISRFNKGCCFDYYVKWGIYDEEWGCLFVAGGSTQFIHESSEYIDDPSGISFFLKGNTIELVAQLEQIGYNCAKYGDSQSETYTTFKKQ